jgi:hypothetical protein
MILNKIIAPHSFYITMMGMICLLVYIQHLLALLQSRRSIKTDLFAPNMNLKWRFFNKLQIFAIETDLRAARAKDGVKHNTLRAPGKLKKH